MPEPLSPDLRERIVKARMQGGWTSEEVAELFQVGRATVNRLVKRFREKGSVEPDPHGGGREKRLTASEEDALVVLVTERADATIPELVSSLKARVGKQVSTSTLSRSLARLGFTRKKSLWSRPSEPRSASRRYARAFVPGREPWTLVVSSSSTKPARTSR